jgi:hypothetical protein
MLLPLRTQTPPPQVTVAPLPRTVEAAVAVLRVPSFSLQK